MMITITIDYIRFMDRQRQYNYVIMFLPFLSMVHRFVATLFVHVVTPAGVLNLLLSHKVVK